MAAIILVDARRRTWRVLDGRAEPPAAAPRAGDPVQVLDERGVWQDGHCFATTGEGERRRWHCVAAGVRRPLRRGEVRLP